MRLGNYEFSANDAAFSPVKLNRVCLLVGATGSGKTRFLTTIFSLGSFLASDRKTVPGSWRLSFSHANVDYEYELTIRKGESGEPEVEAELLRRIDESSHPIEILRREGGQSFLERNLLPNLGKSSSLVFLLKEEAAIRPVQRAFGLFMRRNFSSDLDKQRELVELSPDLVARFDRTKSLEDLYHAPIPSLSAVLLLLQRVDSKRFNHVCEQFKTIFPHVSDVELRKSSEVGLHGLNNVLVLAIKERGIARWIPILELSSGMLKVLLILTDLAKSPVDSVYMIDEYENSLGINAIDFLPELLEEHSNLQFLITSHHPYIINNIPLRDWYVFGRDGPKIQIRSGPALRERYGTSKQEAFTQLINDPFFRMESN